MVESERISRVKIGLGKFMVKRCKKIIKRL